MATGGFGLNELANAAARNFQLRFGRAPRWTVAAPGRVNLIGEHIDYNDGFVLPMAIERYCVITADAATGGSRHATIHSAATKESAEISTANPARHALPGHWSNYFAGVLAGCIQRGMYPSAFDALVESSVPFGGGLSSSAAIEVATATLLEAMTGKSLEPVTKALICQAAEHEYARVPCGIMDMFASTMCRADHLMLLDCRSREIEHIPFVDPRITVLIINSNVKHELVGGEYAERRRSCELAAQKLGARSLREASLDDLTANRSKLSDVEVRRARHAITEIGRTVEAASAIRAAKWPIVGQLMYASHESLHSDFEVSCEELDLLVNLAREIGSAGGVIGSRMTGGGFGGCTVSLVETGRVAEVSESIASRYRQATGIEPAMITSRPAQGAHVIN